MVVQIILLREFMAVFYGNELCIGLVLASWLFWVAIGSWLGSALLGRPFSSSPVFFLLLQIFTYLTALAAIVMVKFVRPILHVPYAEFISLSELASFAFIALALPCLLIGLQFALLASLAAKDSLAKGDPSATVYAYESLGSMVSGLILTLAVIRWFSNITGLVLFAALILAVFAWVERSKIGWGAMAICLLLLVTPLSRYVESRLMNNYWQSMGTEITLLDWRHSRLGELAVVDWGGERNLYANGIKVTSLPDPIGSQALASLLMNQHPSPGSVLLIGGGLGGLAPELARYEDSEITYLELEASAFRLALAHLDSTSATKWQIPNLHIVHADGRFYLRQQSRKYDLIIVNIGRPASAASNRFYTREFFQLAKKRLRENGILALCQVPSSAEYMSRELLRLNSAIYQALKKEFTNILILPADEAIFLATDGPDQLQSNPAVLAQRYQERGIQCDYFFPQMFSQFILPDRIQYVRQVLERETSQRINQDFYPISYFADLVLWHKLVRGSNAFLSRLSEAGVSFFLMPLAVLAPLWLVSAFLFRHARRTRTASVLLITAVIGFAGLAFNVLLILAYQTIFGYIYEQIGLALAAFMLGLAVASLVVNRFLPKLPLRLCLLAILLFVTVTALAMPAMLVYVSNSSSPLALFLLIVWSGAILGAAFPLLCQAYSEAHNQKGFGSVYAADLLGGMLGSILLSGLMVPLLGFANTLALTALLTLAAAFGLILLGNPHKSID